MDFNAAPVLSGKSDLDETAERLLELVTAVAAGRVTKSEKLGHREFYIPYKYQEKTVLIDSCPRRSRSNL